MRKKLIAGLLTVTLAASLLTGCGKKDTGTDEKEMFKIGVNQLVTHAALDASYQGFIDALKEAGYEDGKNIKIDYQNANNDQSTANTIATKLVNDGNDLILAIATQSALACANATTDIPILITAVTDPAGSGLVSSNEAPGGNVTGTSDLNPVTDQIALLTKLLPTAKNIAILYCSSESNSKIQVELATAAAEDAGLTVQEASVSNSNEIQQVVQSLVGKVDAIYAPTDNTIASGMPTVAQIANENNLPVICGEAGMVDAGGLATYGIDYYELGKLTGAQAVKIIKGETETAAMPIEYLSIDKLTLTINEEVAAKLGVTIPDDLKAE
ncbi:ABC transporter substrate-binding protein [Anaeromicropila populeti]|uniref:Putative ABC transport system substrate-binding protein n=1 Tax=Anaeromicropila populeti TaxID=37658 RepID=A0A1I6JB37_9FIRM|nr:ABC transporter substrate-binding protein [Anaeromicropila populeti]SFR76124.1 putative ABC transport system substrate-binding protein [Anaeromicropila populeti]